MLVAVTFSNHSIRYARHSGVENFDISLLVITRRERRRKSFGRGYGLTSEMASSMASLVPEPMEKWACVGGIRQSKRCGRGASSCYVTRLKFSQAEPRQVVGIALIKASAEVLAEEVLAEGDGLRVFARSSPWPSTSPRAFSKTNVERSLLN